MYSRKYSLIKLNESFKISFNDSKAMVKLKFDNKGANVLVKHNIVVKFS